MSIVNKQNQIWQNSLKVNETISGTNEPIGDLFALIWMPFAYLIKLYAGTVKHHNVCKHHVAIGTGFKQTERTIFLHDISMGLKL